MTKRLNLYENLFFHLFTSTSRTNRSIPEWSTTIFLATATTLYLMSILIISPLEIENIGRIGFMFVIFIGITLHWIYFLKNDRIFNKFKRLKPKTSLLGYIITGIYTFGGFASILYSVGTRNWIYYLIIFVAFVLVELYIYLFGKEPIKFE